jgi:chloramphenicol O-acetyltransferase type A
MPKKIDMLTYPRKSTYEAFLHHDIPVLSTTCEVDMTSFYQFRKKHKLRFFPLFVCIIHQTINELQAMKLRIINEELYEFDTVYPSLTVLLDDNTISFCDLLHQEDVKAFYEHIIEASDRVKHAPDVQMQEKSGRYFVTNIPWIRFSAFTHPYVSQYASIPIVTVGKFHETDTKVTLPIALQLHHSLADGYHLGEFYHRLEENVKNAPELLKQFVAS